MQCMTIVKRWRKAKYALEDPKKNPEENVTP